jgi:phosphatidylethanolamine-binding protein (PEBP) family uncharacterized protein
MEVIYNNKLISNNEFLKVSETQVKPEIKLSYDIRKTYLLIMYDPDAVSGTYIHWVISNIKNNNINEGIELITYKGPAPPPKTGKHHYIFELFEQNLLNLQSIQDRVINIDYLKNKLGLDEPINKIQFISENDSGGKRRRTRKSKRSKKRKTNKRRKRIN